MSNSFFRRVLSAVAVCVVALLGTGRVFAQPATNAKTPEVVSGELLVKFRGSTIGARQNLTHARLRARLLRRFRNGWEHVQLPPGLTVAEAVKSYQKQREVLSAQPNFVYHASVLPNDPRYSSLYGMTKIGAPQVWNTSTGSENVVVAIIDTGVNYNHEDLSANMWRNPGETPGNGIDDDGNGVVDDVHGLDARNGDADPMDDNSHGSHCAGTIGGAGNNGVGVAGVNWRVRMMALKFLGSDGAGTSTGAIRCFEYATVMKQRGVNVRVTNNSWGGGGYDPATRDAINIATQAGILNICAAGNEGSNNDASPSYPAGYESPGVVAVAASDSSDNPAWFSNYGATTVDLAAPGVDIVSSVAGGTSAYASFSGTSMATPHVAGAAALLCAVKPTLSVANLRASLLNNVDVLPQWSNKVATGGRLNVARAVASLSASAPPQVSDYAPTGTHVARATSVSVGFLQAMNRASTQSAWSLTTPSGASVSGTFAWPDDKTLVFTPNAPLNFATTYTATLRASALGANGVPLDGNHNGVANGTPADNFAWSFTTLPAPPANDGFENATPLSGKSGISSGTTESASKQSGEPNHAGDVGGASVWFRWTSPGDGTATWTTKGSNFDTLLAAYSGTNLSSLSPVASNDDASDDRTSSITFDIAAGTTYYLVVDGWNGDFGAYALNWTTLFRPTLNSFSPAFGAPGAKVTLNGLNFSGVSSVQFNGLNATFSVVSDSQISATVPANAFSGPITVANAQATATSASNFLVTPRITSFSPTSGAAGASVSISGANFSTTSRVMFNSKAASFTIVSDTQITAFVPATATTGRISVMTLAGTVNSSAYFTITSPVIISYTPSAAPEGAAVTINGAKFEAATNLRFNGVEAVFTIVSPSKITTTVPVGATTGPLSVTNPTGTATSVSAFKVTPTISSFSPLGGAQGASVTISGTTFSGATSVKFNGRTATFNVVSPTQITATVPVSATSGIISVTTAGGTANTASSFIVAPRVTSFSPSSGSVGAIVTINGANFGNATQVAFNGASANFSVISTTQLRATVPQNATTGKISVTNAGGTGASTTNFSVTIPIASKVVLSTAEALIAGGTSGEPIVRLTFTGALDAATASDIARYAVRVNGVAVPMASASCATGSSVVTLSFPSGAFATGDSVNVAWTNLRDTSGAVLSGQSGPLTAH